jgi:cytochrome c biogenesis protein CcdA/thiol-disulfide isomerase/thioredoxin
MFLIALAYLGGVLTILSPCILPVLPLVFARADQPFVRSGLPLLTGMAFTFALVASLAVAGGAWVSQANEYCRVVALAGFGVFGFALLFPGFAQHLMRPLVNAGNRLQTMVRVDHANPSVTSSFVMGIATGLLWAPCAGPILGLVLTGAAVHGESADTTLLLLAYAAGAATSLAMVLRIGGRILAVLKRSLGVGEFVRRGTGGVILFTVTAMALGLDTRVLAQAPTIDTARFEEALVGQLSAGAVSGRQFDESGVKPVAMNTPAGPSPISTSDYRVKVLRVSMPAPAAGARALPELPVEGSLPSLSGAVQWLNSPPLTAQDLRGKVVIVNFWTYSCINCLRTLPYVKAWAKRYHDQGLVVIGVHTPEFAFEHDPANVKRAAADLGVDYPVAIDNNYGIWRAFGNQYWPAFYVIDPQGRIRYHHFGEGGYGESEQVIRQLLAQNGNPGLPATHGPETASGTQVAADENDLGSGETYVGYGEAQGFASREAVLPDEVRAYSSPEALNLNTWSLDGQWKISAERAQLASAPGKISFRFHARDLHLVLGPAPDGKPVRFRVTIDGQPPGASHGADIAADGSGTVNSVRLYQLARQTGPIRDRTFTVEFLDPGVSAYAFTFG